MLLEVVNALAQLTSQIWLWCCSRNVEMDGNISIRTKSVFVVRDSRPSAIYWQPVNVTAPQNTDQSARSGEKVNKTF